MAFHSAASERLFRELYAPADDAMVPDIFVVSMKSPLVGLTPAQPVVCVHRGVGYSLLSPAEADYNAEQTGERPPPGRFVATGAPHNDRLAPFLAATPECARTDEAPDQIHGLTGGKPLVLVGSHWTPGGILRAFGGSILDALAPLAGECEMAQISHPNLWEDLPYDTWHPTNRWPSH